MNSNGMRAIRLVAVVYAIGVTGLANAASVTILNDNRTVRSSGNVASDTRTNSWSVADFSANDTGVYNQTLDEARFAGANVARSVATIASNISTSGFVASGEAFGVVDLTPGSGGNNFSQADALSQFEVRFTIDEPTNFSLRSLLEFDAIAGINRSRGNVQLQLTSDFFSLSSGTSFAREDFERNLLLSGTLDPDTYTLRVIASVDNDAFSSPFEVSGRATYDVRLDLAPIPVPAAVWLFASGLGMLLMRRSIRS